MSESLPPYKNQTEAARVLAECLKPYQGTSQLLVLHLPGAVEIGYKVATALDADLDVLVVRKLELPGMDGLPMGAIARCGVTIRHRDVLSSHRIPLDIFKVTAHRESGNLYRRELAYRGDRSFPEMDGRCVILVDVGLDSGSTMQAAIKSARYLGAERIVVAVPVARLDTLQSIRDLADDVVCPVVPMDFESISSNYQTFPFPGGDDVDVVRTLHKRFRKDHQTAKN